MRMPCYFLLLFVLLASNCLARPTPPNFVIIILDDWGLLESGAYGNSVIQTPNIDHLAQQGLQFTNAFLTASTCSSSRASILTSLHPVAAGVRELHIPMPSDRRLISYYLKEAGYFTASVGKWHIGEAVKNQFDKVILEREELGESHSGAEDWVETIETLPKDKPFFLWLAAKDPHKPWAYDPKWAIHSAKDIQVPPYVVLSEKYTHEEAQKEMAQYYDEIHRADTYIGQVVDTLKKNQRMENTVLIIMSDNGPPFWKAKKFLTDPGLRTPFIVAWPQQIKQHAIIDELISSVDIAPTLLSLAGVSLPPQFEGYSFSTWLQSPQAPIHPIREFVYGERGDYIQASHNGRSIRDKKFLYIVNDYKEPWTCMPDNEWIEEYREELYDVQQDPYALNNLANSQTPKKHFWQQWVAPEEQTPNPYATTLTHYRSLMNERRLKRNDPPDPVNPHGCEKK